MRVVKPNYLSLLARPYEFQRRFHCGLSALVFVPLGDKRALYSEVSMWKFLGGALGDVPVEEAVPKRHAEYLVTGSAYPPGGPAQGCLVRAEVGGLSKRALVLGDRTWAGRSPTDPLPFESMPLDWAHAFGGEGFEANPLGKGRDKLKIDGETYHPLPNVEHPDNPIGSKREKPDPVGFGPIDLMWPQRARHRGTYDKDWFENRFPGFPDDIDWRFFNRAPEDQHFPRFLAGDESYGFEHMHPERPQLTGSLPGVAVRCFIDRDPDSPKLEEVTMRLATAWFFPDAERAVLIYQGDTRVREEDASDIQHVMLAAEELQSDRRVGHYEEVFHLRTDPETAVLNAMNDQQLVPEALIVPDPDLKAMEEALTPENLAEKNIRAKAMREVDASREMVASHGLDPDVHAPSPVDPEPPPPPTLEELPAYLAELERDLEKTRREAEERGAEIDNKMRALFDEQGMDYDDILLEREGRPQGPPTFTADQELEDLKKLSATVKEGGGDTGELDEIIADPERYKSVQIAEEATRDAYLAAAHEQDAVDLLGDEQRLALRDAVRQRRAAGEPFTRLDLTGADLSGMDLSGADFSEAFLESACFDGANLTGANFTKAVLARASFAKARLDGARFTQANLGEAVFEDTEAAQIDFSEAILSRAVFRRSRFAKAVLKKVNLSKAVFEQAAFPEADLEEAVCIETDLGGVSFEQARLQGTQFVQCKLAGASFAGNSMEKVVFVEAEAPGVSFAGATMLKCVFAKECQLRGADFSHADMKGVNLRGADLREADFSHATFVESDLSEADLSAGKLYRIVTRSGLFLKTVLVDVDARSADLRGALMGHARIQGADFRGACFYTADLARVRGDARTRFDDAFFEKTRTEPKWEEQKV